MNIFLWVLQIFFAFHTAMGAIWKFSNPAQTIPQLKMIPHEAWMGMAVFELLCSVALILPVLYKPWAILVPIAAACIAAEMLMFCGLHLYSGDTNYAPMIYWIVVAVLCGFLAYGRFVFRPL